MLGPKIDGDSRAEQSLAVPSPARSGVVLIVRKTLALPASRARLTRTGLLLLPTRSSLSWSTSSQLRSPLRCNGGRRCGALRSRRIGRPGRAGANQCHRVVSRHRARGYKPVEDAETTTHARIRWERLGKRTSRRRRCPPDGTGTSLTHKCRLKARSRKHPGLARRQNGFHTTKD